MLDAFMNMAGGKGRLLVQKQIDELEQLTRGIQDSVMAIRAQSVKSVFQRMSRLVREVIRMIERSEYKRQQAAPGIKISSKAFGSGRRFPIAAKTGG